MARGIRTFDFNPDGTSQLHDIRLDSAGNLAIVEDLDEIKDRVSCSILLHQGEDPWNENFGIDYEALALLSPLERPLIPAAILAHVLSRPGVNSAEIVSERVDPQTRGFHLEINIEADAGSITVQT